MESREDLEGSVVWMDGEGGELGGEFETFVLGAVYRAKITLKVKGNYSYDPAMRFAYYPEDTVAAQPEDNFSAGVRELLVSYKAASDPVPVPSPVDLTNLIPAPVINGSPVTSFFEGAFGGTVVWKAGGTEKMGPFEPLTAYAAAVTLYAGAGYIFSGGGAQATHGGGTLNDPAEWTAAGPSLTGIIITFPAAGKGKPIPAPLILTNLIPAPVTNGSPVTSFFAGAFCGTVVWTATLGGGAHSGLFGTGAAYTAAVSLYPASGYVFPESVPVTHGDLGIADFTGEPRQGTISFPATHIHSSFSGPFSGSSDEEEDSVIDLIRAAKDAGLGSLYLHLPTWKLTEEVSLGAEGQDIPGEGLVLNTTNSPAEVIIDGGGRTIQLTGGGTGSLITLEAGVTLTIRNITFMANPFFNGAPLVHEIGEMLILETGAVIYEDVAAGGTVNYAPVDNDAPNIWEIHTFTETGLLEFITGIPETAEVLVVGGGGGGGGSQGATSSGGGAGRFVYHPEFIIAEGGQSNWPGAIRVTVGAGGNGGGQGVNGSNGDNSEFVRHDTYKIIAPGGGGAAGNYGVASVGNNGGSGGGSHGGQGGRISAVAGTVPAGDGTLNLGSAGGAYSGGGAGGTPAGMASVISGVSTTYAAGGGIGGFQDAVNGTGNGGHGGGGAHVGGKGGDGIVIVRFKRAAWPLP